jgi:bis(5'-nucleosyl)-tetraphosphatase (symmetrical)
MRFVDQKSLTLDFNFKDVPELAPQNLCAWMNAPNRLNIDRQILFGHWASLNGRVNNNDIVALDTGCVWGGYLSAIRLEDRRLIQVASCV